MCFRIFLCVAPHRPNNNAPAGANFQQLESVPLEPVAVNVDANSQAPGVPNYPR